MVDANSMGSAGERVSEENGFVLPPSWHGLKQQVTYLAQFGGGIQVVVGAPGAGKSTFARWLSEDSQALSLTLMSLPAQERAQPIFSELLQEIGLRPAPTAASGELLVMLRSYVQSLHRDGSRVVVLIDDAHLIADAELAALMSVIEGGGESGLGLHLILMAEPGLVERIDRLQLIDVVVHDSSLPALSPSEIAILVEQARPVKNGEPANASHAQSIWGRSRGLPGRAIALARASSAAEPEDMQAPKSEAPSRPMRGWPIAHVVALVVLGCILLWAFLVQSDKTPEPVVTAVDVRDLLDEKPRSVAPGEAERFSSSASLTHPEPDSEVADYGAAAKTEVSVTEPVAVNGGTAVDLPVDTVDPAQESIAGLDPQGALPVEPAPAAGNGSKGAGKAVGTNAPDVSTSVATPQVQAVPQEQKNISVKPSAPVAPAKADLVTKGEAQLLRSPGNAYVLQLMASSAHDTLIDFVERQPNRENLLVYRAERDGKLLHILVEGFYADKAAASAAIANLPSTQRKAGPWPKKIDLIHRDINAVRRR